MKTPTDAQVKRLPQWAQDYVRSLERALVEAEVRLAPLADSARDSVILVDPYAEHTRGRVPRALEAHDTVQFVVAGGTIDVSRRGKSLNSLNDKVQLLDVRSVDGTLLVEPSAANVVYINVRR